MLKLSARYGSVACAIDKPPGMWGVYHTQASVARLIADLEQAKGGVRYTAGVESLHLWTVHMHGLGREAWRGELSASKYVGSSTSGTNTLGAKASYEHMPRSCPFLYA